jgi:hypothetical protein
LLELLVVMLLLGLIMGVVAPQSARWLSSAQQRGWRVDLMARLASLPVQAFLAGTELTVDAEQLSKGLQGIAGVLRVPAPLRYDASGMAFGGQVELLNGAVVEVWLVAPITGEVSAGPLGRDAR